MELEFQDGCKLIAGQASGQRATCGTIWTAVAPVPIIATRLSLSFSSDALVGDPPVTE